MTSEQAITCMTTMQNTSMIQKTPALTEFKGPTILNYYRRISVIANVEIKAKLFKGIKKSFCYRRISITGLSVRAGFNYTYLIELYQGDILLLHLSFPYKLG